MPKLSQLTNFDDFLNGSARQFNFDPTNMPEGAAILAELRQIDPNARFINTGPQGDSGNSTWQIDYDRSKLPTPPHLTSDNPLIKPKDITFLNPHMNYAFNEGGENGGPGQFASYEQQSRSDEEGLFKPELVNNDPIYGRYTMSANVKPEETGWKETAWQYAPAAIMALASLGTMAGPAAAMAGATAGAGGTFAGLTAQQLANIFQSITSMGRGMANGADFDPIRLASALLPVAGASLDIPSEVTSLARVALGRASQGGN